VVGLFLDWTVLHWIYMRKSGASAQPKEKIPLPAVDISRLRKPAVVVTVVVAGFFVGVPPAMMAALGAAALLITRTIEPRKLYDEVDWGLLVFFIGLFLIVGGAENAGIVRKLLEIAEHWNLRHLSSFVVAVTLLSDAVEVPDPQLCQSPRSMVGSGDGVHLGWKSDHHRQRSQYHRSGERPPGN
jgi:Na+/H+ antiporter NhaD/arsenite permease-like protein